jgi:FKBP-type peptidyl-prolyl cis-trans isomerase
MIIKNNCTLNKGINVYLKLFFILLSISSCNRNSSEKEQQTIDREKLKEQLVKVNKVQTYSEQSQIEDFLKRYKYPMQESQTGLRYYIYQATKGKQPGKESVVTVKYEVKLLDGTVCYNSAATGDLEFQIGKTDLPVGLQEAILLMKTGEKAILIAPSKLGYGLTGDGANIPSNAVLVYDVELLKILKQ